MSFELKYWFSISIVHVAEVTLSDTDKFIANGFVDLQWIWHTYKQIFSVISWNKVSAYNEFWTKKSVVNFAKCKVSHILCIFYVYCMFPFDILCWITIMFNNDGFRHDKKKHAIVSTTLHCKILRRLSLNWTYWVIE